MLISQNLNAMLLLGATTSGKTSLAIELTQQYPIEIISVDSVLIYQDMNIGAAKPSLEELANTKHHLIDIISPVDSYSVAQFIADCTALIKEINLRGNIALLTGGTMMYFNALLNGLAILPPTNLLIRDKLEQEIKQYGLNSLYQKLSKIDPIITTKINQNDTHRIMRAIEIYYTTGQPLSQLQQNTIKALDGLKYQIFALMPERNILHNNIDHRSEAMIAAGFIEEVVYLKQKYSQLTKHSISMRSVGYAQIWQYLDDEFTKDELLNKINNATHQLAKHQTTWLRAFIKNFPITII